MRLQLEEPQAAPPRGGALFALGFRPFYMLASVFAALSVPLWALQFSGLLPHAYLAGPLWHAHEMLFGFTLAVVVGFLFTAGRNWTQQPTPTGLLLAALAALWLAARVLVLTPWAPAAAVANVAFPLAAAAALAVPFLKAGNRRNYFFIGLLVLLAGAAAGFHLQQLGVIDASPRWAVQVAMDVMLFIVAVMAGRVVPMFTNNGVPGAGAAKRPGVEKAALSLVLAIAVADLLGLRGWPLAVVACAAAVAHAWRWLLWRPWNTRRVPLVWVLHLAYAWVPVHLLLRGLGEVGWVSPSLATHALTAGAIGGLVIGMMTRTALGHTGRPLKAGRPETVAYIAVLLAALTRVAVPLLQPAWTLTAVQVSAALWSAGFAIYAVSYWPVLSRPRVDGLPG
ncbi:NnrS family protein [Roseateles cellulosilyticus]|uniref:NnrS family protein n=1 Tax=Pelomonas cellulosilytica TaxID=2906762 RepID=A0ABS8XPI2_9BURK|nr:NnrS family protein [Pelomonas sp. P8]MCE4554657.1 NnrS family protein [Pelomonas sp. P8]